MEVSVQTFLDSVTNPNTKKEYRHGVAKFCTWFEKSVEEILALRQDDLTQKVGENLIDFKNRASRFEREIEKFHGYLLSQGCTLNTSRNQTIGIRQLFRFYQMPVVLRTGCAATKTVKTTRNFPLTIEHVRRMYAVADLRERVILSMATDLGLRIGDFVAFKRSDLPQENTFALTSPLPRLITNYGFSPYDLTSFTGWSIGSTFGALGIKASSNIDVYSHLSWKSYIDKLALPLNEVL